MNRWIILIVVVAVAAGVAYFLVDSSTSVELPMVELEGVAPPVREKIERLTAETREDPTFAKLMRLGRTLHAHRYNQAAIEVYQLAVDAGKQDFEPLYLTGVVLENSDRERAIEYFRRAIEAKNDEAIAHLRLARNLELRGDFEEARLEYEQSVRIFPQAASHLGVARMALDAGDVKKALASIELAMEFGAREAATWSAYSSALQRAGRSDESARAAKIGKALRPSPRGGISDRFLRRVDAEGVSFSAIKWQANLASAKGRLQEAHRKMTQALSMEPDDPNAWLEMGVILLQMARFDEAIAAAETALEKRPDWPKAIELKGTALGNSERLDEARVLYEEAVARFPDDSGLNAGLAVALQKSNPERSLHHYGRAVEIDPTNANAAFGYASLLANSDRHREAREQLKLLLQTTPKHADALTLLAILYFHSENRPEAKKVVRRLLKHHPKHPRGQEMLRALGG